MMSKCDVALGLLLIAVIAPTSEAQGIRDRLKKAGVTVTTGKDTPQKGSAAAGTSATNATSRSAFVPPTMSLANPDVLGIRMGVSTADDVRTALKSPNLSLVLDETLARMTGQSKAPRGYSARYDIPNSDFVAGISAATKPDNAYQRPKSCEGRNKACQFVNVRFAGPPNKPVAIQLTREIGFGESGPLAATVVDGLIAKYGPPGFRTAAGDGGVQMRLAWAWAADGRPVALNERHPCASQQWSTLTTDGSFHESQAALEAGCAAIMSAIVQQENSVARSQAVYVADHFSAYTTGVKTVAFVDEAVLAIEACERERAAKDGVSSEFGDPPAAGAKPVASKAAGATSKSGDKVPLPCGNGKAP